MRHFWLATLAAFLLLSVSCKDYYITGYYDRAGWIDTCGWKHPVAYGYQPDEAIMDSLRTLEEPFDIKVFTGTWCNASRRYGSRLLLIEPELPVNDLLIISVDTTKMDPKRLFEQYEVDSIPVVVFERNGEEIGRIKGKPKKRNLERHMWQVLKP